VLTDYECGARISRRNDAMHGCFITMTVWLGRKCAIYMAQRGLTAYLLEAN